MTWVAVITAVSGMMTTALAAPRGGVRITDNLFGTHFVDADTGWAVGAFGTIFCTRDGGNSWRPQVSHTTEPLFSVDFADARDGWIAGRSGLILHTRDGGATWQVQPTGSERHLFTIAALDPQRAWAVGDWGTILATQDGGATWENRSLERDVILNGESWPDATHGWIVGEAGTILATADGGRTWSDQVSGVEKTLFGVYFVDLQNGWAVGLDGILLHTADGGRSWQVQQGSTEVGALEQVGFQEALGHPSLYGVTVVGKYGYAVGDIGTVLASEDGGQTWHRKDMPAEWRLRWIRAVSLVSGTHGILVGANGLAVRIAGDQIQLPEEEGNAAEATR
ncbi:MAG: WD40/YVTN/BNR-like repeat-containing protein [Betaproteobacteria bacterium]